MLGLWNHLDVSGFLYVHAMSQEIMVMRRDMSLI